MGLALAAAAVLAAEPVVQEGAKPSDAPKMQQTCLVMGGAVNTNVYVDVKGCRVYACCGDCVAKIKADPDKCLAKIGESGETPVPVPGAPGQCSASNAPGARCCGGMQGHGRK